MKLKNAGINSRGELEARLNKGEIFYYNKFKVFYDDAHPTPYRVIRGSETSSVELSELWDYFAEFNVKQSWEDELKGRKKAIPCWVSNVDPDDRDIICLIVSKDSRIKYKYVGGNDGPWVFATPIQPSDCLNLDDWQCIKT